MGQCFQLVAPRAKMYTEWRGKPGEILFEREGEDLVRLLAVPVGLRSLSPTPDVVVSASASASASASSQAQNECPATEAASDDSPKEMREGKQLKRKADGEVNVGRPRHQKQAKTKSDGSNRSVTFSNLPVELHRHIFTRVEFIEDLICLGLTSRYFWAMAREYVHEYYTSLMGEWAGENIVFVGEDVDPGDYPPGLFSAEEVDELNKSTVDIMDECNPNEVAYSAVPFKLDHFTLPNVSRKQEDTWLSSMCMQIHYNCRIRSSNEDAAYNSWTLRDICPTYDHYFPDDHSWILRNLTTKEFVRSEAVALRPEFIRGPNIDFLGFGEVVMSRTFWSTYATTSMSNTIPIHRGVWAGHKFDITTLARHRDGTAEAEWTDVSGEVASEIAKIWESELGPGWREIVCDQPRIHGFS